MQSSNNLRAFALAAVLLTGTAGMVLAQTSGTVGAGGSAAGDTSSSTTLGKGGAKTGTSTTLGAGGSAAGKGSSSTPVDKAAKPAGSTSGSTTGSSVGAGGSATGDVKTDTKVDAKTGAKAGTATTPGTGGSAAGGASTGGAETVQPSAGKSDTGNAGADKQKGLDRADDKAGQHGSQGRAKAKQQQPGG